MPSISLRTIREEHASLSAVLHSLRLMLDQGPGDEPAAFFDVMRAMLFYIDEFPERQHHPKESQWLFPRVAERSPQAAEAIVRLDTGEDVSALALIRLTSLELGSAYNSALRKREPPVLERLTPQTVRAVEKRLFQGSYKGVTDLVTKYVWPAPARVVTRWAAMGSSNRSSASRTRTGTATRCG